MRHYTVREVAGRYGVHESTIRRHIGVGRLRLKRIRGTIQIAEDAIEALERLTAAPPPRP